MTATATMPPLLSGGHAIDLDHVGFLRDSSSIASDTNALRERIEEEGYLYLPRQLDRNLVFEAREEMTRRLAVDGHLKAGSDPIDAIAKDDCTTHFKPDLAKDNRPLMKLLYAGKLMDWFELFFGEPVRHFDFTW